MVLTGYRSEGNPHGKLHLYGNTGAVYFKGVDMDVVQVNNCTLFVDYISTSYEDGAKDEQKANARDVARIRRLYPAVSAERLRRSARYGYRGFSVGSSFIGRNATLRCLEIHAGDGSRDFVLPDEAVFSSVVVNRIDFTVDLLLNIELIREEAIRRANNTINHIYSKLNGFGRNENRKKTRIESSDGGLTVYVGSRQSDRMLRVYNKTVETPSVTTDGLYPSVVRIEVELKDKQAQQFVWYLWRQSRNELFKAAVGHFMSFGVQILGYSEPEPVPWIEGDDWIDRRLSWLRRQVAPSIEELLTFVDKDVVLSALGLD
jgi:hypothetical protein